MSTPSRRAVPVPGAGPALAEAPEPEPQSRLAVDLIEDDGDWSPFPDVERLVGDAAAAAARHPAVAARLPAGPAEIAVALSSDAAVAALNGQFRAKPQPTNVLSFPAPPGTPAATIANGTALGDIVLAVETILAEAAASATDPAHHLQHLVVHAVLHLFGYDHMTSIDAEEMEAVEIAILATLAIPDPYAGSEPAETAS